MGCVKGKLPVAWEMGEAVVGWSGVKCRHFIFLLTRLCISCSYGIGQKQSPLMISNICQLFDLLAFFCFSIFAKFL